MKKILVITYYWPPELGVGVQRIQKFCQYLSNYGYEPVVLTISPKKLPAPEVFTKENGLDVARIYYWFDPARWLSGGGKQSAKPQKTQKANNSQPNDAINYLLHFIWLNFFIPDSKIGWYNPAKRSVDEIMKKFDIAAVLSTGPPFTPHLIGLYTKKKYRLPWIVDARDPWVENVNYNYIDRFKFVVNINEHLERKVYANSDAIVSAGDNFSKLIKSKTEKKDKVKTIYNGYDEQEFINFKPVRSPKFIIGHYGSILNEQIPYNLLNELKHSIKADSDFSDDLVFEFYGPIMEKARYEITSCLPERNRLIFDSIPRGELINKFIREQLLILLISSQNLNNPVLNELIVSSKIFEYIRTGWPILVLGPVNGEAANIVQRGNTGKTFTYEDKKGPVDFILKMYRKWKSGGLYQNEFTNPLFERKEQAKQLAQLFDGLLGAVKQP